MTENNYDELLYTILCNEGNIIGFFDKIFEFSCRRVDYFKIKRSSSNQSSKVGETENIVRSNAVDIKKLKSTIKALRMTTKKKLCAIKGLSETKVDKIKEPVEKMDSSAFASSLEVSLKEKHIFKISTGSEELDKLFGGGVKSMSITEVFGESSTGKTQLSHTLCVTGQLPVANDCTGGKVMFIDTENTFRPNRLRDIADRYNLDYKAVLSNLLYYRAYTSEQQLEILDFISVEFYKGRGVYKLLIVDSIMALLRSEYAGRGKLADRQQKLAQMLSKLKKIAEEYNVAVFFTNQMTADPGDSESSQINKQKPIGGNILAHCSTTRIYLRKGSEGLRIAKLYHSPNMPENEATFAITAGGIADAKD